MQTTTITVDDIRSLRREAMSAQDYDLAIWCDIALSSCEDTDGQGCFLMDPSTGKSTTRTIARSVCAEAIANAAAMAD